jgi:hypothetical protein
MIETEQHAEAPEQVKISNLLVEIAEKKQKLEDAKIILKSYKIKSDRLDDLKSAAKELREQIKEEKDRIEDEFYEDQDYEQAKNDELTYKNEIKEKTGELSMILHKKYKAPELQTEDHTVNGEMVKLQLQFVPDIYLNGKALK